MKDYLFEVLLAEGTKFIPIKAEGIGEARKKFRELMKKAKSELNIPEWFLVRVYREV